MPDLELALAVNFHLRLPPLSPAVMLLHVLRTNPIYKFSDGCV
jgi:hypothetical protein